MDIIRRGALLVTAALFAGGCAHVVADPRTTAGAPHPSAVVAGAPHQAPTPNGPPAVAAVEARPLAPVVLSTVGDLDGRGAAPITLDGDGVLRAGARTAHLQLEAHDSVFWVKQASLRVVVLARDVRAVLVSQPTNEAEDPPNRFQLFVATPDGFRLALDRVVGAYGVTELRFPGDGTAAYVEDAWTACERRGARRDVVRDEVVLRFDRRTLVLVEAARRPARRQRCDQLAG